MPKNRTAIGDEMSSVNDKLKNNLKQEFFVVLSNPHTDEWVGSNLGHGEQNRRRYIIDNLKNVS